jgi:hypothetical protein
MFALIVGVTFGFVIILKLLGFTFPRGRGLDGGGGDSGGGD